ncbi:hypothetical protein FBR02_14035 [Anaerolineae bacterium CFX9]|nr:hypothetical protein [Anaerolineae bacterium CFX9]
MLHDTRLRLILTFIILIGVALLVTMTAHSQEDAQTPEPPTETPVTAQPQQTTQTPLPIVVSGMEPGTVRNDASATLSLFGSGFSAQTTVRLVGLGLLPVTYINPGALMASVPAGTTPGVYAVEVSDPVSGTTVAPISLTISPPPTPFPTPGTLPTFEPPTPMPTPNPPTPVPGQPSLVARSFIAVPSPANPGDTIRLVFDVVNQGSRTAEGVSVSVGSQGTFSPANGVASVTLPNLPPGASARVEMSVVAARNTPVGAANIPIQMTYRDFSGETYTSSASLSVIINESSNAAQIYVARYNIEPNPVTPGEPVIIELLITNSGSIAATNMLVRVSADGVVLPGASGDSFPIGSLQPGQSSSLRMPLIVATDAEAGPQAQGITISYTADGEAVEVTTSVTITVDHVTTETPRLLLSHYSYGEEILRPGLRFVLDLTIDNVGRGAAQDLMVTFGNVESSGGTPPPSGGGSGSGSGDGGSSTTTSIPGNAFATLGTGGTHYIGDVGAGEQIELSQEFIVSGSISSGIYSLPVTLRYVLEDGESVRDVLPVSVVVVSPPRVQTTLETPLPETVMVGEPIPLGLSILNLRTSEIAFFRAEVIAENADVLEGGSIPMLPLKGDKDTLVNALIAPQSPGPFSVTYLLYYRDDLNQERVLEIPFEGEAVEPEPMPEPTELPPEMIPPIDVVQPQPDNSLGLLLLGLLGLGG